ncbi:hypothetical protein [Rhodococcus pyridinivorans]|uniref:hypothetical protein n=1 Tax=Rhodococcus pyridinivorans TaxID=103816 RepID=UPI00110DF085|nr:hypothetical protein [Rhodococcus pyridinivorans]
MTERIEARYMITYHFPDGDERQSEWEWTPAVIGNGYVDEAGRRYRIVDVWIVLPAQTRVHGLICTAVTAVLLIPCPHL